MTREKEIIDAAEKYYNDSELKDIKIFHFVNGAKWADKHPKEGLVNIDSVIKFLKENIDTYSKVVIAENSTPTIILTENFEIAFRKAIN